MKNKFTNIFTKRLQPALIGSKNSARFKTNVSYTVIKGGAPDGTNLIKTNYNLPKNASYKVITRAIKSIISTKFQGNSYSVGKTKIKALINARTKNELTYKQPKMSKKDFIKKGSLVGNYDELLENVTNATVVKNHKPAAKPDVDYYISGRVAVDLGDGEIYYPRIDIEVSHNGKTIGYDIADIKKYPRAES